MNSYEYAKSLGIYPDELIAAYEKITNVPQNERVSDYFGDLALHTIKSDKTAEQVNQTFLKALKAIGLTSVIELQKTELTGRNYEIEIMMCKNLEIPLPENIQQYIEDSDNSQKCFSMSTVEKSKFINFIESKLYEAEPVTSKDFKLYDMLIKEKKHDIDRIAGAAQSIQRLCRELGIEIPETMKKQFVEMASNKEAYDELHIAQFRLNSKRNIEANIRVKGQSCWSEVLSEKSNPYVRTAILGFEKYNLKQDECGRYQCYRRKVEKAENNRQISGECTASTHGQTHKTIRTIEPMEM